MRSLVALLLLAGTAGAADISFTRPPVAVKAGDRLTISFTVSKATDVEVAVLNAKGEVVRHLAAGVLGGKNAPPEPLKQGLAQDLVWDGTDNRGKPAAGGLFLVGLSLADWFPAGVPKNDEKAL